MDNFVKIARYTILDQLRHKSFFVLMGIALLFIMMVRGCYDGNYTVNGQNIDAVSAAWHASLIVFHVITFGMMFMASLLAMKIISRDQQDGSMVLFLSHSVHRWHYLFGRIAGIWILSLNRQIKIRGIVLT